MGWGNNQLVRSPTPEDRTNVLRNVILVKGFCSEPQEAILQNGIDRVMM
jgi:hypothetical protein